MQSSEMQANDQAPLQAIFFVLQEIASQMYTFWFVELSVAVERYNKTGTTEVQRLEKYIYPKTLKQFLAQKFADVTMGNIMYPQTPATSSTTNLPPTTPSPQVTSNPGSGSAATKTYVPPSLREIRLYFAKCHLLMMVLPNICDQRTA